jgi:hypothetical protein
MSAASQAREKLCYDLYMKGLTYDAIAYDIHDELTINGVKQALKRHRKRNDLPNGRNVKIVRVGNRMKRICG